MLYYEKGIYMKDTKIQWHPAFVAAMNLELREDRENLIFQKEHNLNTKPLSIDLLIIQKSSSAAVSNEIGRLFRGHNIMEYKSPGDSLDIDVYYKTMAYAALYKSNGDTVNAIKADDITISLVWDAKPLKLFQHFRAQGCSITEPYSGIYYIEGSIPFPAQVLVTQELDPTAHAWLCALSKKVTISEAQRLLDQTKELTESGERNFADSVITVMLKANKPIINNWKGAGKMFEILMELMEPQIEAMLEEERKKSIMIGEQKGEQRGILIGEQKGEQKGEQRGEQRGLRIGEKKGITAGILGTINTLREFGHTDTDIKPAIMRTYSLSSKEADDYLSGAITVDLSGTPLQ